MGFTHTVIQEDYSLSDYPVNVLIFRGERSGIIHNFTMDVVPGYTYIEKFQVGVQWYMMESNDVISSVIFEIRNGNNNLVSFNGQWITFRLSIKAV